MKKTIITFLCIFCASVGILAHAEQDMENVLNAVVRIHSKIPDEAYTAQVLGASRTGNGVLIDLSGTILTIGYLIIEAESIEVTGPDGRTVPASFLGYDFDSGFGLLRADTPLHTPPIKLGRSSDIKEGDRVLVASYGGKDAVQGTRVIARSEFTGSWEYLLEDAIFTSPPHMDFSGAPLIGLDGRLLGIGSIYTLLTVPGAGRIPINMFVPIDLLRPILSDLKRKGRPQKPPKPWLGLNVEESHGRVFIVTVTTGGPAEKAGIQPGDIILTVDGRAVNAIADFYRTVWSLGNAGIEVRLSILQGIQILDVNVISADRYQFLELVPKKRKRGSFVSTPDYPSLLS
jgi:S1-C subfamily serine protease